MWTYRIPIRRVLVYLARLIYRINLWNERGDHNRWAKARRQEYMSLSPREILQRIDYDHIKARELPEEKDE